jgi:hypothetical protein
MQGSVGTGGQIPPATRLYADNHSSFEIRLLEPPPNEPPLGLLSSS